MAAQRKRRAVRPAAKDAAEGFLSYARPPAVSAKRLQPAQKNALSSVPLCQASPPKRQKQKQKPDPCQREERRACLHGQGSTVLGPSRVKCTAQKDAPPLTALRAMLRGKGNQSQQRRTHHE
jgi:hypothetical protein